VQNINRGRFREPHEHREQVTHFLFNLPNFKFR
jgi:hypothetical protein